MPRKTCLKIIRSNPPVKSFLPSHGECAPGQHDVSLLLEEWEALRLVDYAGMEQRQAALSMGISRQSVQMLVSSGRAKIARAIVEGLPLNITGTLDNTIYLPLQQDERVRSMHIAVAAHHTEVFPHFGRTPEFYMVTAEDGKITNEAILPAPAEGHGALVGFLVQQGVDTVICGGIGAGAINGLRSAGIRVYAGASGSAKEQVLSLLSGVLPLQGEANCEHHEGHEHHHNHGQGCSHHP